MEFEKLALLLLEYGWILLEAAQAFLNERARLNYGKGM